MTEEQESITTPVPESQKNKATPEDELKEYKEKYLRLLAEIDNTRKRMQKEKQEMTRFAVDNVIAEILDPVDNLENALQFTKALSDEMRNWAQGFLMILGQFKDVLANHGVTAFHSEGMPFNPQMHHAIEKEVTTEKAEGTILKEYVKGYRSGDHIIRPASVKVAVAPGSEAKNEPKETEV
jgi:molecular chaperone GrpE